MLPDSIHRLLRIPYVLKTRCYGHGKITIVFLHGIASYKEIWQPIMQPLEHEYRCVTIDLLGHGHSSKPTNIHYDVRAHIRSIRWTLFWRGIWRPKIIVGYSMGGIIGVHWTRLHPRWIEKLVLVSMPIYHHAAESKDIRLENLIDKGYLTFYKVLRNAPRDLIIRSARALVSHMPTLNMQARLDEQNWYPVVSSLKHTIEEQTTTHDIKSLPNDLPIEVLYGSLDQVVLANNLKKAFIERPRTRLTRVNSSHEIRPKMYQAIVRAIIREPEPAEQLE
ncbi:alpha/beta fold hydrolase [bacterium]|nr:alpha/beta fold hydrolase [bacterium]